MTGRGDDPSDLRRELASRYHWNRRRFLGLMAAGTGAVAFGACSSGGSNADAHGSPTTTETGGPTTATTRPSRVPDDPGLTGDPFMLGISSGDPLPSSVILWTRLAPEPGDPGTGFGVGTEADVPVLWEVATDDGFSHIVASGIEPALAELGHSVHADATGLRADTWYHYRFRIGSHTSPIGHSDDTGGGRRCGSAAVRLRLVSAAPGRAVDGL